ncbi:hypothetical protein QBC44DRAFT_363938 [Cladorrhinum sp. PSN332]|nr:hypothetical protein QBC44DRAFT_363938 [Cladorrhinum sp. PSN332]
MADSVDTSARPRSVERERRHPNGTRSPRHSGAYDGRDVEVYKNLLDAKNREYDELRGTRDRYRRERDAARSRLDQLEEALKLGEGNNQFLGKQYDLAGVFLSKIGVQDFDQALVNFDMMARKLEQTGDQLTRLQKEVLSAVDRFDPNYDAKLIHEFSALNTSIGFLTKSKDIRGLGLLADPLGTWDPSVFWPDSVSPLLGGETKAKLTDGEKRLLFRQAIWKFLSDRLFLRSEPFASYGGEVGKLASNLPFEQLYPDHVTNESAGKWRSLTTRALSSHPSSAESKQALITSLSASFISFLHSLVQSTSISKIESLAAKGGGKDLPQQLTKTLSKAIEFSRLLNGERAGFQVCSAARLDKDGEDAEMTVLGSGVGVIDGPDVEHEAGGEVKLVGSPMLVKWGNGGGQNLEEKGVLVKGFVVLF